MKINTRFTGTGILISAAVLTLPSCRIINGKPDFNWITDQFTPVMDDSVVVDRGIGALDIPAAEILPQTATPPPIPAPEPKPGPVAQVQPQPSTTPQAAAPQQPVVYTVVAGDTLSGIATRHHTKTRTLIELNKLDINKPLQLNQKLLIPTRGGTLPATAKTTESRQDPGFFSWLFGQSSPVKEEAQPQSHRVYTVVAGDTLSAIARSHGTRTKTLIDLNRLDINKPLQINQKLLIPTPGKAAPTTRRSVTPPQQEGNQENPPTETTATTQETGSTPQQQDNTVTPTTATEQPLPPAPQQTPAPAADSPPPAPANSYIIQPGDTLFAIARKLNISPDKLMEANGLTPETADKLQAGASLNLPTPQHP
ncbi:MAG: LysM peptidoglycan-binding domain-containing protein [Akkermansia sp.]|nr:LysM peptidoglycan-binding domain-containing protein [Akkermansia sp.]